MTNDLKVDGKSKGLDEKGFPIVGTIWGDPTTKETVKVLSIDFPENYDENIPDWQEYCSEDDPDGLEFTSVSFESVFWQDEDWCCGTTFFDFMETYEYLGTKYKGVRA